MKPKKPSRDSLYQPDRARSQIRKAMGRTVDLLSQDIQFGCRLLEDAPSFVGDSNRYAARHLYRLLLGTLDSVDTLLLSGSGDEARVLLRRALELTAQLQYLAIRKENYLLGTAFMIEMGLEMAEAFGSDTEKMRSNWPVIFHQAERELQKTKSKSHRRIIRWYSIQNGPIGIRKLIQATKHSLLVDIWDDLSRSVHASVAMEAVERRVPELERKIAAGGPNPSLISPLRTSAQVHWGRLVTDADMLWLVSTLAIMFWEDQAIKPAFTFNRKTRLPLLQQLVKKGYEEVDLLCILERSGRPDEPPQSPS
jgi:hypothetical protein